MIMFTILAAICVICIIVGLAVCIDTPKSITAKIVSFIALTILCFAVYFHSRPYKGVPAVSKLPVAIVNESAITSIRGMAINLNKESDLNFTEGSELDLYYYPPMWSGFLYRSGKYEIMKDGILIYRKYEEAMK